MWFTYTRRLPKKPYEVVFVEADSILEADYIAVIEFKLPIGNEEDHWGYTDRLFHRDDLGNAAPIFWEINFNEIDSLEEAIRTRPELFCTPYGPMMEWKITLHSAREDKEFLFTKDLAAQAYQNYLNSIEIVYGFFVYGTNIHPVKEFYQWNSYYTSKDQMYGFNEVGIYYEQHKQFKSRLVVASTSKSEVMAIRKAIQKILKTARAAARKEIKMASDSLPEGFGDYFMEMFKS